MDQYGLNLTNANLLLHEYKCVDYFENVTILLECAKITFNTSFLKVSLGRNSKAVANW